MSSSEKYSPLLSEVTYQVSRAGGKGGQHVNKVSTRVELLFDVQGSSLLEETEKNRILSKLSGRISDKGILRIVCDDTRSQSENRERVKEKFLVLIQKALVVQKPRKKTKVPEAVKEQRLKEKKRRSVLKESRRK